MPTRRALSQQAHLVVGETPRDLGKLTVTAEERGRRDGRFVGPTHDPFGELPGYRGSMTLVDRHGPAKDAAP